VDVKTSEVGCKGVPRSEGVCAWDAAKNLRQQFRQMPEQYLRIICQRECNLSVALMLLEQGLAVMFDKIHC